MITPPCEPSPSAVSAAPRLSGTGGADHIARVLSEFSRWTRRGHRPVISGDVMAWWHDRQATGMPDAASGAPDCPVWDIGACLLWFWAVDPPTRAEAELSRSA